jgi:hypothetical protein
MRLYAAGEGTVLLCRMRMVLWRDEGCSAERLAVLAGVSRPTVISNDPN